MTEEKPLTEQEIVLSLNSNYKDKYVHLIGQDAALEAAKMTVSNKTYGYGKHFLEPTRHFLNKHSFYSSECK